MGSASAIAELEAAPVCPEEYQYLFDWALELFGTSGAGLSGPAPVSYSNIEAWSRLRDIKLETYEVKALAWIDGVLRNPGEEEVETSDVEFRPRSQWPKRKSEV